MVGSVHLTSALLVQRGLDWWPKHYLQGKHVTFASPSLEFHPMVVDILVYKDHEGSCDIAEEQNQQNGMTGTQQKWWQSVITAAVHHSRSLLLYCWCNTDGQIQWTRSLGDWKFLSGHCLLSSLLSFSQSALSSCVYTCQTWKWCVWVCMSVCLKLCPG